ncbi:MAG: metallopeptidase TldD-related protein [Nocardioides sp.]
MRRQPTPQDLVEHALASSTGDDCIVIVKDLSSANLRWANNTVTTNGATHAITLTAIGLAHQPDGVSTASVSGAVTTLDQVSALVSAADSAARKAPAAEDAAELVPAMVDSSWSDPPARTDIEVYAELAPGLGQAFARASAAGRVLFGFVDHQVETTYLGSSTGLHRRHEQPMGYLSCTAKNAAGSHSAWWGRATRDFDDIDPLDVDATLAKRLGWGSRAIDLPAGRYDTILPPEAVADLSIYAMWAAAALDAYDGQSVYGKVGGGTRIGERLAAPGVHLFSDPEWSGLPAAPFVVAPASGSTSSVFDNGVSLARTDWLTDGVLGALLQTRHTAQLTGQPVTPPIGNLILDTGGHGTIDDLVANTERGLLLTCLWYIREVDPQSLLLTGLTRDGVYLIEDGEVTATVNNFRFNESPIDLLNRCIDTSATTPSFSREWGEYFPWTSTPALRVADFNMSSVSQAT